MPAYLVEPGRVDGFGEDSDLRAAALGRNEARLNEIRRSYDPNGLFDTAASLPRGRSGSHVAELGDRHMLLDGPAPLSLPPQL